MLSASPSRPYVDLVCCGLNWEARRLTTSRDTRFFHVSHEGLSSQSPSRLIYISGGMGLAKGGPGTATHNFFASDPATQAKLEMPFPEGNIPICVTKSPVKRETENPNVDTPSRLQECLTKHICRHQCYVLTQQHSASRHLGQECNSMVEGLYNIHKILGAILNTTKTDVPTPPKTL